MKEDSPVIETGVAGHLDVANEPVTGEVDEILELGGDPEAGILQRHRRHERVFCVTEMPFPTLVFDPSEFAVDEEACTADVAHRLVGVADSRKVNVTNRVVGVEAHEHVAISDDEASRHALSAILLGAPRALYRHGPERAPAPLQSPKRHSNRRSKRPGNESELIRTTCSNSRQPPA